MADDKLTVRPKRKFVPVLDELSVRERNALHAVGVDLCAATHAEILVGIDRALDSHIYGCGEVTRMGLIGLRQRLAPTMRTQFWAVSVTRNAENLVTIESGCLSGKPEFTEEEARVIRMAAENLLAFIGPVEGHAPFIVDDEQR